MHELGLELLKARFGALALRKVEDEPREIPLAIRSHLANGKFHWEGRPILAQTDHDSADTEEAGFIGAEIARQIAVVLFTVGRRHHYYDVLTESFRLCIAE